MGVGALIATVSIGSLGTTVFAAKSNDNYSLYYNSPTSSKTADTCKLTLYAGKHTFYSESISGAVNAITITCKGYNVSFDTIKTTRVNKKITFYPTIKNNATDKKHSIYTVSMTKTKGDSITAYANGKIYY